MAEPQRRNNILGRPLQACCKDPPTGFRRDGYCSAQDDDIGTHVVCAEVTEAFLQYSRAQGNDLMTPRPEAGFKGLVAGDTWCLCASRWQQALAAGVAPPVHLASTDSRATDFVTRAELEAHAVKTH